MRVFVFLASLVMLVSSNPEPPTSYSSFSSQPSAGVSFQNVPSVANLQYSSGSGRGYSAPSSSYGSPSSQQSQNQQISYGAPSQSYGSPSSGSSGGGSSSGYSTVGSSQSSSQSYGSPSISYGSPSGSGSSGGGGGDYQQQSSYHGQSQPANIQVSYGAPPQLPPGATFGPNPIVTGAGPDHDIEYRVVYKPVKAPKPDIILPPPPPRQKTIVYILVPRIEAPDPIIVPTHPPTPPSKPEVYFIRYKAAPKNKNKGNSGNSLSSSYGSPSQQYGSASAPKSVIVNPPSPQKRSVAVTVSESEVTSSSSSSAHSAHPFGASSQENQDETPLSSTELKVRHQFGDRVKFERDE
jgi:hypothetical protein